MRHYVPFLVLLFLIAAFFRVDFYFTIVYLIFAVYLLSHLWVQRAAEGLRVERRFVKRAFCGDQVAVELIVRETSWLPVAWLHLDETLPVQLMAAPFRSEVFGLGPRGQQRLRYNLACRQRGYYPVGPLSLWSGDVLGVVNRRLLQIGADHLIVYPQVLPLHSLGLPTHSPLAILPARSALFEDPTRVVGVRDYAPGDGPRHIHWTATASAGRLLVKRYRPAIARETLLCLDMDQASYEDRRRYTASELAIVAAASLANHMVIREKLPVGLLTEGWDPWSETGARFFLPPRAGHAHLMSLLEVLARLQLTAAPPLADMVRRESTRLAWGATLLLITGRADPPLFDSLLYLRRAGFAVSLIVVEPVHSPAWADIQRRAGSMGIAVRPVWRAADVEAGL